MGKSTKKIIIIFSLSLIILFSLLSWACEESGKVRVIGLSGQEIPWPSPFPCRIEDNGHPDLFLLGLGQISTPLARAVFNPVEDKITLPDGLTIENYFREN